MEVLTMFARQPDLTYAEYLTYEQASPTKHEFVNREAFAMAGVSEDHNLLVGELFSRIWNHLLYRRDIDGRWLVQSLGTGDNLYLQSLDLAIALSEIYEDVEL